MLLPVCRGLCQIANLATLGYDGQFVVSDASRKCSKVAVAAGKLYWSYLTAPGPALANQGIACPSGYATAPPDSAIGCAAGAVMSSSVFTAGACFASVLICLRV